VSFPLGNSLITNWRLVLVICGVFPDGLAAEGGGRFPPVQFLIECFLPLSWLGPAVGPGSHLP
jgi:hypothetical protein